jgi:CheY-like chemotaxis protein
MKKILVIEDNENNMYLMRFILKKNGYEVIESTTGKEGIELAIKERPDLILLDIQLPDIDGMEAAKKIRESEADGKVPIVAVTSFAMAGDRERILSGGCTGYIEKPLDLENFIAEIKKYL